MTADPGHCAKVCNRLLRGERSAVETYDLAINKYGSDPAMAELRRIRSEHADAVARLEKNVLNMGGTPSMDSGAWGAFAETVQSTADLFGEKSAVESLIRGEKHGLNDYEDAVSDDGVMPDCKNMFRTDFIPRQREHLATLQRLQKAA